MVLWHQYGPQGWFWQRGKQLPHPAVPKGSADPLVTMNILLLLMNC